MEHTVQDSMEQALRGIVARIAETSQDFAPGTTLREGLDVDSLRWIELFFEIESEFQVQVPKERYVDIRTFEELLAFVKSLKQ